MHLMATNLAMWIHIVIKESVLELSHVDHENSNPEEVTYTTLFLLVFGSKLSLFQWPNITRPNITTEQTDTDNIPMCDGLDSEILGDQTLATINPYLSPFAIEFLLVGACVAYVMFQKIGKG